MDALLCAQFRSARYNPAAQSRLHLQIGAIKRVSGDSGLLKLIFSGGHPPVVQRTSASGAADPQRIDQMISTAHDGPPPLDIRRTTMHGRSHAKQHLFHFETIWIFYQEFTRFFGLLMFGSFSVINIIVLLNLLIAMMNHSYQLISVSSVRTKSETQKTTGSCILK
jgi:hypothetical protein